MLRRFALLPVTFALLWLLAPAAMADSCPNEGLRTGPSANLPDCRAYEMVSPQQKNGFDVLPPFGSPQKVVAENLQGRVGSSATGESATFTSASAFEGAVSAGLATSYRSVRAPTGWSTEAVSPLLSSRIFSTTKAVYNEDLTGAAIEGSVKPQVADVPPGVFNIYVRDNTTGALRLALPPSLVLTQAFTPTVAGAAENFSRVIFEARYPLLPGDPEETNNLYEAYVDQGGNGQVRLVSDDAVLGSGESSANAVSSDGSRVVYDHEGQVLLRENGTQTTQVSASQRLPADPNGPGTAVYQTTGADASRIFFTSTAELTDDANTGVADEGTDLYEYDVPSGVLRDRSVDTNIEDPTGAGVSFVLGASQDGSYVYFLAGGRLVPGKGVLGQRNLYVSHDGAITFIATLAQVGNVEQPPARVTPDGTHLAFVTSGDITGYDSQGYTEVYLYDAVTGAIACASCRPDGTPPTASTALPQLTQFALARFGQPRDLTADGSELFFSSLDAVLPQDSNGSSDVYEYDADTGQVQLISTGQDPSGSYFADASSDGRDVFFTTRQRLLGIDRDANMDMYDARVDGGFTEAAAAAGSCAGETCQGQSDAPPLAPATASSLIAGPGNLAAPVAKPAAAPKIAAKPLTRAQKLAKALKACRAKRDKHKRATCEAQARKSFGKAPKRAKKTNKRGH
jgi:hypothetical protein